MNWLRAKNAHLTLSYHALQSTLQFCSPFEILYDFASQFKIDLSIVNVTCKGATAPIELFFNIIIMGVCIIIIESNFQMFRGITFNPMNDVFMKGMFQPAYKSWAVKDRGTSARATLGGQLRYFITILMVIAARAAGGFDFFQAFMQFL